MDFLSQIAEYSSAYSTPQVLAALPSHSVFLFSLKYCLAFSTLLVLATYQAFPCLFLCSVSFIVLRLSLSEC